MTLQKITEEIDCRSGPKEADFVKNHGTGERERHHYKGSVSQTETAGYSAHSDNYTMKKTQLEVVLDGLRQII